jgi:hypothetical protein
MKICAAADAVPFGRRITDSRPANNSVVHYHGRRSASDDQVDLSRPGVELTDGHLHVPAEPEGIALVHRFGSGRSRR